MSRAVIDRAGTLAVALGLVLGLGAAFSVLADGADAADAALAAEWMPLAGTEPGLAGEAGATDLARLSEWLGKPAILGLGEDPHGTSTLHQLAQRYFEYLVEHEGFETFALEIDQAHASLLDDYVQGRRQDVETLVASGFWGQKIFYDGALVDLLRWMRQHNKSAAHPVHVAGFDAKQPQLAADLLLAALSDLDRDALPTARRLVERSLRPGAFGVFPNVQAFTASVRVPLPAGHPTGPAHLELRIEGRGTSYGTTGFLVRPDDGGGWIVRSLESRALTAEGATYAVDLDSQESTRSLELALFHRGDGTVSFGRPTLVIAERAVPLPDVFEELEPWPLMMPALQRLDYRPRLTAEGELEVVADPVLADSLGAAKALEELVETVLRSRIASGAPAPRAAWIRQLARLITEAVEWRTLAEPNR
ncbi:MAG: erythromycin esterase family protein, partial [Acidobacteria bacterium]|nr:erythromycin esterase family protein [Acidobacteriota bacterium]